MRALAAAGLAAALLLSPAAARAADAPGVPVLMYHKVDPHVPADAVGRSLTLEPAAFEAQLRWLRERHIATLTLAQLVAALAAGHPPAHAVVLTFDDGYTDAATYATPLLVKYGARASFYVSAGFVGDGRHAGWRELRAMRAAGMEIGCHGTFHRDLTMLDRAAAAREIDHCADTLARYLGRPTTYAYAAGKWNALTIALVRSAGFVAAVTERPGMVRSLAARYELPRRRVDRDDDLRTFAAIATP
jgi:peptidoglycan/xylan/chitin deacetylase (PgdA/CDA1 family)